MLIDRLPRVRLGLLPTPVHRLERLEKLLGGPELWIKRDDLTGFGAGGNKVRKLELLLGDATTKGADTVITAGRAQSNHARQTAAAAAALGWKCILVLMGQRPAEITGNLLLDDLFGAFVVWAGDRPVQEVMDEVANELRGQGRCPYIVPYGGSNELGAAAFAEAVAEMNTQAREIGVSFDRVIFASGSAGTHAGMVTGAYAVGFKGQMLGVAVDRQEAGLVSMVESLAAKTASLLDLQGAPPVDLVHLNEDYLAGGYGIMGEPEKEAIHLMARTEGILVDPVYTGRALAGLIDLVRKGEIGRHERALFWHTGGMPGLFAYAEQLLAP